MVSLRFCCFKEERYQCLIMSPGFPLSIIASGAGLYISLEVCVNTLYEHRNRMTRSTGV